MTTNNKGMSVDVITGKAIVKSAKVGTATADEIKWLTNQLLFHSAKYKNSGWAYIVDVSKMNPVTPDISVELVNMTKNTPLKLYNICNIYFII